MAPCALTPKTKADPSRFTVEETSVVGHDGTPIPLSIVSPAGAPRDGRRPTILIGYGSYGVAIEPTFMADYLPWVERGGVLAIAHIRGGGELGAAWHAEGQKMTKLNTIFDFIACGQHLVDAGYTDPHHLAAMGGSAGDITVGMAMNLRPDLFGVVLDDSGMADMMRFETEPNGPPQTVEFGSLKTREGFRGLYAMSPYIHVRDGVRFPAVLLCPGGNDPLVSPWHSAKMAARLQAATSSRRPVLLRVDYGAGHGAIGAAASQRQALIADQMAFALWQMGEPGFSLMR
jgi:prolyl oligopeptidase